MATPAKQMCQAQGRSQTLKRATIHVQYDPSPIVVLSNLPSVMLGMIFTTLQGGPNIISGVCVVTTFLMIHAHAAAPRATLLGVWLACNASMEISPPFASSITY
jgi:hypothetical protein